MEKQQTDFNLNGTALVQSVWKRKYILLGITVVALVVSLVISFLITPMYKSSAILIPSSASQASKDMFVSTRSDGITVFGEDEEVEHLLQILSSETLRDIVIDKENLYNYYGVNPQGSHALFKIHGIFSSNVSSSRTHYRTVKVTAFDSNPAKAAQIANTTITVADSLMRSIKGELAHKAYETAKEQYQKALNEFYQLTDSMSLVMSKGVLDLPNQAKEVTKAYAEALSSGKTDAAKRIKSYMEELSLHGAQFTRYAFTIENKSKHIVGMEEGLHFLAIEAEGEVPSFFVVDRATPSDKKAKPKKAVIVVVSTLSALFFAVFISIFIDFFRHSILHKKD